MKPPPPGVWVGRGLAVLGLAAVGLAVALANAWALVAAAGGFLAATGLALVPLVRIWLSDQPATRPSDVEHMMDLLRRAHGAKAAWAVGLPEGDVEVAGQEVSPDSRGRGAAIVQLASVDGRAHVVRESEGTYVAVGDFPFGAGLLLAQPGVPPPLAEAVSEELRRLVAGMRLAQLHEPSTQPGQLVAKQLSAIAAGAKTLEGIAKAGAELAQQFSQRGAAIVLHGASHAPGSARVVAVSTGADSRLVGLALPSEAPVMRAVSSGLPVVTQGVEDIFGTALPDRRRQERAGTAYPVFDGHFVIGALVVMGPPIAPGTPVADQMQRLVTELGSRLAAARALYEAEQRAVSDPLTGLRNLREFERRLALHAGVDGPMATLIYADLDWFKTLNDTLGHAAGDSALRHVAQILTEAVRGEDLAARIGGEEFAVWMPHAPIEAGLEVAERIRQTVERTVWRWDGTPYPLTVSCGVAAYPESVGDIKSLRSAADAALYRAKQGGRNRVEKAAAAD
jgi:diguanylate cyclase (GGDEF)-like protein